MAATITPLMASKPLSEFHKIGYSTYLYTPDSYTPTYPLILLFAWNTAAAKNIAKYTATLQRWFPDSRIVLIRCDTPDMFVKETTSRRRLVPAMDITKEHVNDGGEVLVHSFSNGGGNQMNEFAKAWVKSEGGLLPMRAQIMDSSPGKGGWMRSHAAITASLPRTWIWGTLGSTLVHMLLAMVFVYNAATGSENKFVTMCRELNDPAIFDVRIPRVYLYSKADLMVCDDEVEAHADEAEAKGWDVTKVKFENSAHAGHVREDEDKYWGAVMAAWKAGPRHS